MAVAEAVLRLDASQVVQAATQATEAIGAEVRAHQGAAAAAKQQEASLRDLNQTLSAANAAFSRLEVLAASTASERAAIAYRRQRNEIEALAHASGRWDLAARAIERLNEEASRRLPVTTQSVQNLNAALADTPSTASAAARGTGQVGAAMVNLGAQAQDVFVQLSMGANPLMVLAQQGPQIASAVSSAGGFGSVMAAAAPVLTMLAPVVAGLAASFALFAAPLALANHELDKMTEKADKAAAAAQRLAESRRSWAGQRDEIALQVRVAAGEITEAEAAFQRASQAYSTARRSTQAILAESVRAAEAVDPNAGTSAPAKATFQARKALEEYNAATERGATLAGMLAERRILEADATGRAGDAAKDAAKATREHESAIRSLLRAMEEQERIQLALARAALALRFSRGEMGDDAYQLELSRLSGPQLEAAGAQATANEATRQAASGDNFRALQAALTAQTFSTDRNTDAVDRITAGEVAGRVAGVVNTIAGGPQAVMGAVASAGPWGALIAAIVDLVANFEDVAGQFHDFHMKFTEALGRFPQTIAEILPKALVDGTEAALNAIPDFLSSFAEYFDDIIVGIAESLPDMIVDLVDVFIVRMPEVVMAFLVALLDPRTWVRAAIAFVEGIGAALVGVGDNGGAVGTSAHTGPGGTPVNNLVDELFYGGSKSTGSGGSKSRSARGNTYNITYAAPVMGIGPDTSTRMADEISRSTALRRPA